jgi:hypothetical protein
MREQEPSGENELAELLVPEPRRQETQSLQQAIFMQTARLLRRRRRRKYFGFIALLVACYGAGLGTVELWKAARSDRTTELQVTEPASEKNLAASPAKASDESAYVSPDEDADVPAVVLERIGASLNKQQRAAYYQRAGDRYLELYGDLASAVRCYKQSLDAATEAQLAIASGDNWLLIAMKKARQGEQTHAKSNG